MMTESRPQAVSHIVSHADGSLRYLLDNLARIQELDQFVKQNLPKNLSSHCRVANIRDNRVIIAVDSSVWATRLKFELTELLSGIRQQGYYGLAGIDTLVKP